MTQIIDGVVIGTAGDDTINLSDFLSSPANLGSTMRSEGGAGNDTITGTHLNDIMNGGDGNDTLAGGAGNDNINGGAGDDTISASSGNNWLYGGDGNDTVSGGSDADHLYGGTGNDEISGGAGNDTIFGEDGDDILAGGAGSDTLVGGVGNDSFLVTGDANDATFNLPGGGTAYYKGTKAGADDSYSGGSGFDTLKAGSGKVTLVINNASDLAADSIEAVDGVSTGNMRLAVTGEGPQDFTKVRLDNVTLDFGAGDDVITGSSAHQMVDVDGDGIAETDNGATGNDVIEGGAGTDTLRYASDFNATGYTITLQENGKFEIRDIDASDGDTGTDIVTGIEKLEFNNRSFDFTTTSMQDDDSEGGDGGLVSENTFNGATVGLDLGLLISTDLLAIAPGVTPTFRLTDNAGGRFQINTATGVVTIANAGLIDFETTPEINGGPDRGYTITVEANTGGLITLQTFTILIADGNDKPDSIADSDYEYDYVLEGAATGTYTGVTATASDANAGDTFTYTLTNDAGGRFQIDPTTGRVTVLDGGKLDYETAYYHNITVRATDSGGLSTDQVFTIYLNDFTDDAIIDGDSGTYDYVIEGAATGTYTGVTAHAVSASGGTMTYALTDNADGRFQIDPATGRISVLDGAKLDFEAQYTHNVTVRATDSAGVTIDQVFTIYLSDFGADLPVDGDAVNWDIVTEGAATGTYTGVTAQAVSASGGTMSYALTDDAEGRFQIDPATGRITVLDGTRLDYETMTSHSVTVRATDSAGVIVDQVFTIYLNDFSDEIPVDSDAADDIVAEGAATGTYTGVTARAISASGGTMSYSLIDDAGGRFQIDPATGRITVLDGSLLDADAQGGWNVIVRATDGISFADQAFAIYVSDVVDENWDGTEGDDTHTAGSLGSLTLNGRGGNDTLTAIDGATVTFVGGAGNDTLTGRNGNDVFVYSGSGEGMDIIDGGDGYDIARAGADNTVIGLQSLTGIEEISADDHANVTLQLGGADDVLDADLIALTGLYSIRAGAGHDTILGTTGSDRIFGEDGDDLIRGGAGADVLDGGTGVDTLTYAGNWTGVTVNLATNTASGGDADGDVISGFENLVGTDHADILTGSSGNNILTGGAGDDTMNGGAGDDTFRIGRNSGADAITGGTGADRILLIENDTVLALSSLASVEIIDATGVTNATITGTDANNTLNFSTVTLTNIDAIYGLGGNDTITGSASNDVIIGGSGNDTLNGGNGDDIFRYLGGDEGFDALNGGAGNDTVEITAGSVLRLSSITGIETINGLGDTIIQGSTGANTLDFTGVTLNGILAIDGGAGNDIITGSAGNDMIYGGLGADRLSGGAGSDHLHGGSGNDIFDFNTLAESGVGENSDLICDFVKGRDKIDLSTIDANSALAGDQAFTFIGTGAFTNVAGQLRFVPGAGSDDGYTHVYGDINGDGVADFEIRLAEMDSPACTLMDDGSSGTNLSGTQTLSLADFIL